MKDMHPPPRPFRREGSTTAPDSAGPDVGLGEVLRTIGKFAAATLALGVAFLWSEHVKRRERSWTAHAVRSAVAASAAERRAAAATPIYVRRWRLGNDASGSRLRLVMHLSKWDWRFRRCHVRIVDDAGDETVPLVPDRLSESEWSVEIPDRGDGSRVADLIVEVEPTGDGICKPPKIYLSHEVSGIPSER